MCSLAALFGVISLIVLWYAVGESVFSGFQPTIAAVKLGCAILRAVCLVLCVWAAWRKPHFAVWLAWVSFVSFAVGGYVGSGGNLVSAYYATLAGYAVFLTVVRALVSNDGGPPAAAG